MAKLKDTSVTNLNATEDITVKGHNVYHTGRKPTADELGISNITFSSVSPDDGYWLKPIDQNSETNDVYKSVEITPYPFSLAVHPITNSNAVIMQGGNDLQSEIDELKSNSSGPSEDITSQIEELNSVISTLKENMNLLTDELQQVKNHCPFPINSLFYTDSTSTPTTLWPGTTWQKIEDSYIVATGTNFSTNAGSYNGDVSFSISSSNLPAHNHSFSVSSKTASGSASVNVGLPGYIIYSTGGGFTSSSPSGKSIPCVYSADGYSLSDSGYDEMRMYSGSSYTQITDIDWFEKCSETSGILSGSGSASVTVPSHSGNTGNTGSGTAITYKPKYRTVHVWKRTG